MDLSADEKERGFWRYIIFDGRYQHNKVGCEYCDFLLLADLASRYYRKPLNELQWKHLGVFWTVNHPEVRITVPSESQIHHHARQPEFSFLGYVKLRANYPY